MTRTFVPENRHLSLDEADSELRGLRSIAHGLKESHEFRTKRISRVSLRLNRSSACDGSHWSLMWQNWTTESVDLSRNRYADDGLIAARSNKKWLQTAITRFTDYVSVRQNTLAANVATRRIVELCRESGWLSGSARRIQWWTQQDLGGME